MPCADQPSVEPTIHPTAIISPAAVIGPGSTVGPYCVFSDQVTTGAGNRFLTGVSIGGPPMDRHYAGEATAVIIGNENTFYEYSTVHRSTGHGTATIIGDRNIVMTYVHIAHNCRIGSDCVLTSGVMLGGHVVVYDLATIGGLTGVHQFCRIGTLAMVGACSYINKDIPPFLLAAGNPCRIRGINHVGLRRAGFTAADIAAIRQAYRLIYRSQLNLTQALHEVERIPCARLQVLLDFVGSSRRGIELRTHQE